MSENLSKAESIPLTAAQREIMEIGWARGEVAVAEVRKAPAVNRKVARNSVQTMMVRLEERGWLKHREQGRTFVCSAKRAKTASLGARVSQLVERLFARSPERLMTALLEYRGLSQGEAKRIRQIIREAERKQDKSKRKSAAWIAPSIHRSCRRSPHAATNKGNHQWQPLSKSRH